MAPTLVFDGDGLELAIGAAGGTRLRTALVGVLGAMLHEGSTPQDGDRPAALPSGRRRRERRARRRRGVARGARGATAGRCAAGPRGTTTSAASAPSGARARARIRAGAARSR